MSWNGIRGHDKIVADLRHAAGQGRLAHAFLFVGPEGIGKRSFAHALAQALLCERNPASALDSCGECPGCKQVVAGVHPDVLTLARPADRHELPIQTIRDLNHELALKPMRGRWRVAIVDDADDLSEEAANAFLKTLEEPPPGSILILIGTSPNLQLETIVSRCRVVWFEPLSRDDLAAVLRERELASGDDVERLADLGEGSVARAIGLADPGLEAMRRTLIDEIASARGFDPIDLGKRFEAHCRQAGKESAAHRARACLLIGELARFFRAVLHQTAGLEAPTSDPADRTAAESLARRLEPEDVFVLADRCLLAEYHINRMAALNLSIAAWMHDLAQTLARAEAGGR